MIRKFLRITLLGCFFISFGCIRTPKAIDGAELPPNQGILALKTASNVHARLGVLPFSKESTFGSKLSENFFGPKAFVQFINGEEFVLVPLEPGDYMWSKIEVGNGFAWLQGSNKFVVKPNTITYIGNINLNIAKQRFSLNVVDHETEMREYIKQTFPKYSASMQFEKTLAALHL